MSLVPYPAAAQSLVPAYMQDRVSDVTELLFF